MLGMAELVAPGAGPAQEPRHCKCFPGYSSGKNKPGVSHAQTIAGNPGKEDPELTLSFGAGLELKD